MANTCPHCRASINEPWLERHGLQRLDKGWIEAGIPIIGRVKVHRESISVVYVCLRTNMPLLMIVPSAR